MAGPEGLCSGHHGNPSRRRFRLLPGDDRVSRITALRPHAFNVSPKTNWYFIAIETDDDRISWGEASLNGWEPVLGAILDTFHRGLVGSTVEAAHQGLKASPRSPGGLAANAIISALQQALLGAHGRAAGATATWPARHGAAQPSPRVRQHQSRDDRSSTGGVRRDGPARQVAGIRQLQARPFRSAAAAGLRNRYGSRSESGMGSTACSPCARRWGPRPGSWSTATGGSTSSVPSRRSRHCATRSSTGWNARSRSARPTGRQCAGYAGPRTQEGVLLAAAETQIGVSSFESILAEGLYDVVMPDVKYCGGPWEMLADRRALRRYRRRLLPAQPHGSGLPPATACTSPPLRPSVRCWRCSSTRVHCSAN